MQTLIEGDVLQQRLADLLPKTKNIVIVSAYLTLPAVEWLVKQLGRNVQQSKVTFIVRLAPVDLICGATDIAALNRVLQEGWGLKALATLHAKIYLLDLQHLFIGSANFTSNGLKLVGRGNLEAMVELLPDSKAIAFVEKIVSSSILVDSSKLSRIQKLMESQDSTVYENNWPSDLLHNTKELFVADLPLVAPCEYSELYETNPLLPFAMIELVKGDFELALQRFNETKIYSWLVNILREESEGLYFGALTAKLHDALADDPAPYRRDIKCLLVNLLLYVDKYAISTISITRPRHSQLVVLL